MPEVQEVFRMATQKVRPEQGFVDRQHDRRRRQQRNRKIGGFVAAGTIVLLAATLILTNLPGDGASVVPANQPTPTAATGTQPAGTVTFDGSTCSIDLSTDPVAEIVTFDVVNTSGGRAMFDSYRILEGYSFAEFESAIERMVRRQENGLEGVFPESGSVPGQKVEYLESQEVAAGDTAVIARPVPAGAYAIVCLRPFEGLGLRPSAIVGPISVG